MSKKITYREFTARIEVRALDNNNGEKILTGVIPYRSASEDMGGWNEIIAPSAFAHTLNDGADVKCLIDHDSSKILGRVKNGTLILTDADDGLHIEVHLNNTTYANDLYENVRTGNITAMSFGFITLIDDWDYTHSPVTRILKDVKLLEVSFVVFPAYADTQVQARSKIFDENGLDKLEGLIARRSNSKYQFTDADKVDAANTINMLQSLLNGPVEKRDAEPVGQTTTIPSSYYDDLERRNAHKQTLEK